jgi:hypothetical protein
MPSQLHEVLVMLFRNCPTLAAELLHMRIELPAFTEVRVESADLTEVQPAEYRGDLVVVLRHETRPVLGVIVEVQLQRDPHKRISWPAYAANLRQRLGCDTCVLVFSPSEHVARWAARPIQLGAGSVFRPLALGPTAMPRVIDPRRAAREPELAVLSAMAHGRGDTQLAVQIAITAVGASMGLDAARRGLYVDLVLAALGPAAQQEMLRMDPAKYEYQSEFARHYFGEGEAKGEARGEARGEAKGEARGEAKGRVAVLLKQLAVKNLGPLDAQTLARIHGGTLEELETWAVRVLDATSLADVFDA